MEYTEIPGTALRVSRIALGTWAIGGWLWGGSDEKESIDAIHAAVDRGVNLLDTAPVYGFGRAEEIVGRALKAMKGRGNGSKVLISTKTGLDWSGGDVYRNSDAVFIRDDVERSLKRLGRDTIDVLFVHWPDPLVPFEATGRVLEDLVKEGKVRAVGVSNFNEEQMDDFRRGGAPIHLSQPPYNLFERGIEDGHIAYCRKTAVLLMTYGALCRGLLSGRVTPDRKFTGDDIRQNDPKFQEPRLGQYLAAVARLDALAREKYSREVIHLALRWTLDHGSDITLWGARRPDQLTALEGALGWHIDEPAMREIDAILAETIKDPVGPEFMAPPARERIAGG